MLKNQHFYGIKNGVLQKAETISHDHDGNWNTPSSFIFSLLLKCRQQGNSIFLVILAFKMIIYNGNTFFRASKSSKIKLSYLPPEFSGMHYFKCKDTFGYYPLSFLNKSDRR
jgi:hypothetical protein